jgi:hypothetical protein
MFSQSFDDEWKCVGKDTANYGKHQAECEKI